MTEERFFCSLGAILNMIGAALAVSGGSWWLLAFNTFFFVVNAWVASHG